jgi:exopolysaccharide biosynthesis protein
MAHLKKLLAAFLVIILTITTVPDIVLALPATLYQTSYQETITAGATLEHISRFTADGWLNIKVMRIDTTNPNIKIDTLANDQTTAKLAAVPALAAKSGAVAAVNASFFNIMDGGTGYPDGPFVKSGDLLATAGWYNKTKDEMASFSLAKSGQILFNYWKNTITLTGADNTPFTVTQYNEPSRAKYNDITILDQKWGSSTLGASKDYPDLVEIVVSQGFVQEIRQAQPATTMPDDGFVVISRGDQAAKLLASFRLGSVAKFTVASTPDWTNLQMSATGASMLVKDGKIPEKFSFSTSSFDKNNPRTLVGSSKDGKQLILVTVDGRQDNSIGLTQTQSAELMLELGAYNAMTLDGGGSTTMVARSPGTDSLRVVNIPSEGALRPVANGIGVFSLATPEQLNQLILETDDANIFMQTSRKFTLKGVDRNFNPVTVDPAQATWSVSGITGTFDGNSLTPTSAGTGKVTAKIGEITAEISVRSLSTPVKLSLSAKQLEVPQGESRSLQVTGYDAQGFKAVIQPEDVNWKVNGGIGDCTAGTFQATAAGTGYIDASLGGAHAYSGVAVYTDFTEDKNTFEDYSQADFQAKPQLAGGSYAISDKNVHEGKNSGELTYDFFTPGDASEASVVFPDKGIELNPNTSTLSVWLYNTHENDNKLMGEVLDGSGNKHQVQFAADMAWSGWKELTASLENVRTPAYLTRLYVLNNDPDEGWGKIYLDDLTAKVVNRPALDQNKVPQDTVASDEANQAVTYTAGQNNFRFSVFGGSQVPRNSQEKQLLTKMTAYINKNMDMAVYTGSKAAPAAKDITKTALIAGTGYKTYTYKNSTFLQLDISKGGLRRTDPQEWTWLFGELDKITGSNVFVVMADAPANFVNAKEAELLKDTLAAYRQKTGKNVWVLYQGTTNRSELDRGVRYLACAGLNAVDSAKTAKYLQVTIQGNKVSYEFKSL